MTDKTILKHCNNLAKLHNVPIAFQEKRKYFLYHKNNMPVFESSFINKTFQKNNS